MYEHILIATDGSDLARKGLDQGLALAKSLGARVSVIVVTEPFPLQTGVSGIGWVPTQGDFDGYAASQKEHAAAILAEAKAAADALGVAAEVVHVPDARPAEAIVETAVQGGCGLVVMASHGRRGLGRLLLGSQTSEVLAHATVPVLVVR